MLDWSAKHEAYETADHSAVGHDAVVGKHAPLRDSEERVNATAVAAYRASIDNGEPISERRLAAMFGKTSRRWARHRMAEARQTPVATIADTA